MKISIGEYRTEDAPSLLQIWNRVVEDGVAFPETDCLTEEEMPAFVQQQDFVGVARDEQRVLGMYILHPNGIGRKAHIANASFAVAVDARGSGVGKALVGHCLEKARALGFVGLQFNAVVASNHAAMHVYEGCGFRKIGCIEDGFRLKDGSLSDMYIYYYHF